MALNANNHCSGTLSVSPVVFNWHNRITFVPTMIGISDYSLSLVPPRVAHVVRPRLGNVFQPQPLCSLDKEVHAHLLLRPSNSSSSSLCIGWLGSICLHKFILTVLTIEPESISTSGYRWPNPSALIVVPYWGTHGSMPSICLR